MLNKPLKEITKKDVIAFIEAGNSESRTLEYKRELNLRSHDQKKEFLCDCTAFANSEGGHILFGVSEDKGENGDGLQPLYSPNGLIDFDNDTEINRIESLLRSSVTPRFSAHRFAAVPDFPNGPILIMRIPKSWVGPHMVRDKDRYRFYKRNSAGKNPMDYAEIKEAFALAEDLPQKIRKLRSDRISKISSGSIPLILKGAPIFILHLFPLASFSIETVIDATSMSDSKDRLVSLGGSSGSSRFNVDGFLSRRGAPGHPSGGYCQMFRNGVIESVDTVFGLSSPGHRSQINIEGLETNILQRVRDFSGLYSDLNVPPPVIVTLSILGAEGYEMRPHNAHFIDDEIVVDRADLILPEVILENFEANPAAKLKPLLEALWNAGNWSGSPIYDAELAKWLGRT